MTGNLTETGQQKLLHFDLRKHFEWVSGGENDCDRCDLARRAAEVISKRDLNKPSDLLVIGDTVADIHCGRAIGAQVIAVTTGSGTREQLAAEEPLAVLNDLSDTSAVLELLLT